MGGFIAQTLAFQHPTRVNKLILLSTDPGGADAELRLQPMCGRNSPICPARLMSRRVDYSTCCFPSGCRRIHLSRIPATLRQRRAAQLSPDLVNRQAAAMDAWHRDGVGKPTARAERAQRSLATGREPTS